ncbi:MAG: hypothetical protein IKP95_07255 [Ruminococcus sp.]|nr:hypothetical protein [Ruminococcus sp.]
MKNIIKKHKIITAIMIISLIAFTAVNIVWYFSIKKDFDRYAETVGLQETNSGDMLYRVQEGDFAYLVAPPGYLDWSGRLVVDDMSTATFTIDKDGNEHGSGTNISLYIWIHAFGETKYGFMFYDPDKKASSYGYSGGGRIKDEINEQVCVDKELNYIPYDENNNEFNQYIEKLLAENRDKCGEMMRLAKEKWDFE